MPILTKASKTRTERCEEELSRRNILKPKSICGLSNDHRISSNKPYPNQNLIKTVKGVRFGQREDFYILKI